MEDTETIDANQAVESSDTDSTLSSPDYVGESNGEQAGEENKVTVDDGKVEDKPVEVKDEAKDEDDRFDKHPRFQELRDRASKAEARVAMLEKSIVAHPVSVDVEIPKGEDGEPLFKDITKMSPDDVREWREDDPIGFEKNRQAMLLHQINVDHQQKQQVAVQKATFEAITKTFDAYASENADFNAMWEAGEIEKFMVSNPGHNAISAHMKLTEEARTQKRVDAAVSKAVKETEERITKNFQAKRNATVIRSGAQRSASDGEDPALHDTNKYGGRNSVLAQRLAESRKPR